MYSTEQLNQAIEDSTSINQFYRYVVDWEETRSFETNAGLLAHELYSKVIDTYLYITEQPYGLQVSEFEPDIKWGFEIDAYSDTTVNFHVYNIDDQLKYVDHFLAGELTLPVGTTELSPGNFINNAYTIDNMISGMEILGFMNMTQTMPSPTLPINSTTGNITTPPTIWYFEPDISPVGEFFTITSKAYWNSNKALDDFSMSPALASVLPEGFHELSESIFEYDGTIADGIDALLQTGNFVQFDFENDQEVI